MELEHLLHPNWLLPGEATPYDRADLVSERCPTPGWQDALRARGPSVCSSGPARFSSSPFPDVVPNSPCIIEGNLPRVRGGAGCSGSGVHQYFCQAGSSRAFINATSKGASSVSAAFGLLMEWSRSVGAARSDGCLQDSYRLWGGG